ncbi:MAG: AsmA family protein [Beijerinckiaceae bacterium]|nr:AsmA family protein [Beijerinckiaceae bacterium]
MKRALAWAASAMLAAIVAAGFIPLSFWSESLSRTLQQQILRTTGLEGTATGRVTVAALPYPRVTYANVRIGRPDGSFAVSAESLTAELRVVALLAGNVEFDGLRLVRPQVSIEAVSDRPDNAAEHIKRAMNAPSASDEARSADQARLGGVRIIDGTVHIRPQEGLSILVDRVNATLDWPSLGSTATLSGRGLWRGEKFDVDILLGKPAEVLRGEKSPFTVKLSSRLIDVSADGAISGGARWLLDARLASSSERFTQLLTLFNAQPPLPGPLARFALSGKLRALPQSATLSEIKLSLDTNTFEGSLALLAGAKRPKVSGTLAARTYGLGAADAGLPAFQRDREWSRDGFAIGRLDLFDADLRLSAGRLDLGVVALTDAGFLISLDDGLLEVTTASAEAYGGAFRGRWRFNSRTATPELDATGNFRNINLSALLRGMGYNNAATGTAAGEYTLQTRGSNISTMMQNAAGNVRSSIRAPEIIGLDLERALRRTERRPLSIPSELRGGQTSFTTADIEAKAENGLLHFERVVATGPGVEISATGGVSIADRTMQIEVAARQPRQIKQPADMKESPSLVLDFSGPWHAPVLSIDPETLIRRSDAAAPLWRRAEPAADAVLPSQR